MLYGVDRHGRLPRATAGLTVLALVVSCLLWFPGVEGALADEDVSLVWAASLPELAVVAVLCVGCARLAGGAGDLRSRSWLRTALTLTVLSALAPLPVVASGRDTDTVLLLGLVTLVLVIVLLFRYGSRPWALAPLDQTTAA